MTFQYPRSGPNNVAEYQASGLPWVSSSTNVSVTPWKVSFPYVTSKLSFLVTGSGAVRVGFSQNGVEGTNYLLLSGGTGWSTFELRCKEIFVRADSGAQNVSIAAGLTMIDEKVFPVLTGSAIYNTGSTTFHLGYGVSGSPGSGTGLG